MPRSAVLNGLSVDVEEWFQVGAFERVIDKNDWETIASRVEANTGAVLDLFAESGVTATFFTLGWVAARHPRLIRRIVDAGHEIASHGWDHQRVFTMDAAAFRADLVRARVALEARVNQQEGALRRVLTLLVDWVEADRHEAAAASVAMAAGASDIRDDHVPIRPPAAWDHAA